MPQALHRIVLCARSRRQSGVLVVRQLAQMFCTRRLIVAGSSPAAQPAGGGGDLGTHGPAAPAALLTACGPPPGER